MPELRKISVTHFANLHNEESWTVKVLQIRFIDGIKRVLIPGSSLGGVVFGDGMAYMVAHVPTVFRITATFSSAIVISFLCYRQLLGTFGARFQIALANQEPRVTTRWSGTYGETISVNAQIRVSRTLSSSSFIVLPSQGAKTRDAILYVWSGFISSFCCLALSRRLK